MGRIHTKNAAGGQGAVPDSTSSVSHSLNSLSFAGYLTSQDRQHNPCPIKTPDRKIKTRDQGFEFGPSWRRSSASDEDPAGKVLVLARPKHSHSQVAHQQPRLDGRRSLVVRNNSIRRGGERIREEEDESWSGWSVFRSFASPCRECRASKPAVIEARPIQFRGLDKISIHKKK